MPKWIFQKISGDQQGVRDYPFKTSPFFRGEGSKIAQICRQIVHIKKLQGVGIKNREN